GPGLERTLQRALGDAAAVRVARDVEHHDRKPRRRRQRRDPAPHRSGPDHADLRDTHIRFTREVRCEGKIPSCSDGRKWGGASALPCASAFDYAPRMRRPLVLAAVLVLSSLADAQQARDSLGGPGISLALATHRAARIKDVRYDLVLDVTGSDSAVGRVAVRF